MQQIEAKYARALDHLHELRDEIASWAATEPYRVIREDDTSLADRTKYMLRIDNPLPVSSLSPIAGDAVHNLRTCLDYLVCDLVQVNGGTVTNITAFPVWTKSGVPKPDQTKGLVGNKAAGASDAAIAALRELEPSKGANISRSGSFTNSTFETSTDC